MGAAERAYAKLRVQAAATSSIRLATLAMTVREATAGHFNTVIEAIDKIIAELKQEDLNDIADRDQCKEQYRKINKTIGDLTWKIHKNEVRITKLQSVIDATEDEKTR